MAVHRTGLKNDSEALYSVAVYTMATATWRGWMPRRATPPPQHTIPHYTRGQEGGNVAQPYCAERRRLGVATTLVGGESGRSLLGARAFPVPATVRYGTIAQCTYTTARAHDRRSHHLAFVRTAPPSSDSESHAPTLRDQAREFGCARRGGVTLWTTTTRTVRSLRLRGGSTRTEGRER